MTNQKFLLISPMLIKASCIHSVCKTCSWPCSWPKELQRKCLQKIELQKCSAVLSYFFPKNILTGMNSKLPPLSKFLKAKYTYE